MNIILFGPPGAGKGTQAEMIIENFHIPHLSTGNIFRAAIKSETALGLKVKAILAAGKLVDDQLTVDLVAEELTFSRYNSGAIFDGFPRTVYQAEALDKLLADKGSKIDYVISLEVPDEELIKRVLSRGQGRADDTEEGINKRLEVYNNETAPVLAYFKEKGLVHEIDGVGDMNQIFNRIISVIES